MEGSSPSIEEERTATFYVYHPCYFLQQAFRALLRCLGIESEATMCSKAEEEKSSLSQTTAADDLITNSPSCNISHKNSQDAADPPSTTNQTIVCYFLYLSTFVMCVSFLNYQQNKHILGKRYNGYPNPYI